MNIKKEKKIGNILTCKTENVNLYFASECPVRYPKTTFNSTVANGEEQLSQYSFFSVRALGETKKYQNVVFAMRHFCTNEGNGRDKKVTARTKKVTDRTPHRL